MPAERKKMKKNSRKLLFLLSPAKTLNFEISKKARSKLPFSNPALLKEFDPLVTALKSMKKPSLKKLLKVSDNIADENYNRYKSFLHSNKSKNAKPMGQ